MVNFQPAPTASLQRAIDIEQNAHRYDLLGVSLASLNRWPEAEAAFRRGVKLEPNHPGLLTNLGAAVANRGSFAEAAELFEQSLHMDPNNPTAQGNLAQLREKKGLA